MQEQESLYHSLLGRETVPPDENLMVVAADNKTVMVTGAGGSIGAELCRQLVQRRPRTLILFDCSEFALYAIEHALRDLLSAPTCDSRINIVPVLGSVQDADLVQSTLGRYRVDTIYHAAAYKHVPMLERNVIAGVRNNIFGTWTLARAAEKFRVANFIFVSTDKAVRPANVMGATKRFAEQLLQGLQAKQGGTRFSIVRFGNVLGSSGSVLPLFRRQILNGGPVTVTHPEVSRYFMTASEAAQLVIQAGAIARGGEIFVLDMQAPIRVADMARKLVNLLGFSVCECREAGQCACQRGVRIVFSGLRDGEKLTEELPDDMVTSHTSHSRILKAQEGHHGRPALADLLQQLNDACGALDASRARQILMDATSDKAAARTVLVDGPGSQNPPPKSAPGLARAVVNQ